MGNRWSTSGAGPDGVDCPVCLERCSAGPHEVCQNGHTMHRECAMKMSLHMNLRCPLCRSKMVCAYCRSSKNNLWCSCADAGIKPEKAWESIVKRICKTYFCISVTIFFLPFNPVALVMGILLNSSFMLYRTGKRQHRSGHMKNWSPAHRVAVKIRRIRIVIMTVSLVATTAFNGHLKQFYSGWVQRYPQRLHNPQW